MRHAYFFLLRYQLEIVHMTSDVDEVKGTGTVHMEWLETINTTGVRIQDFNEFEWRRERGKHGKWMLLRLTSIRGFASDS